MIRIKKLMIFFAVAVVMAFSPKPVGEDWELKKSANAIMVYTRLTEGSAYKELKAKFQVKTSLSSVIALLNDVDSYPNWVFRCQTSKLFKKMGEDHLIRYQTVVAPWPVDNRDVIVEVHTTQDAKTGIVYQKVNGLPDYAPKVKNHVRIRQFRALWTLKPLPGGIVSVDYELLVDPAGAIPAWIVNMAVVDGPYETSLKMKELVLLEKYQKVRYPFIKEPE